jgi:hypothetical protein
MYDLPQGETVVKVVRKYWLFFCLEIFAILLVWLVPFVLFAFFSFGVIAFFGTVDVSESLFVFFLSLWSLVVWFRLFSSWTNYYLGAWVITNKRIISIKQKGFFNREISNFRIEKIQDITTKVEGIIETFFDYGDIEVQTAGEMSDFTIGNVPRPVVIKEIISKIQDEVSHEVVFQEKSY